MKILCRTSIRSSMSLYVSGELNLHGSTYFEIQDKNRVKIGDNIGYANMISDITGLNVETSGFSNKLRVLAEGYTKEEVDDMIEDVNLRGSYL